MINDIKIKENKMRFGNLLAMLASVCMLVVPMTASAAQFGIGATLSGGDLQGLDEDDDVEGERRGGQIGLLIDTANPDSIFNYRLLISYGEGEADEFEVDDEPVGDNFEVDYTEFMVTNTFRFRLGHDNVDFWLGPSVYLGRVEYEYESEDLGSGSFFGVGPTVGFNFPMGGYSKLCLEAAYRYGVTSLDEEGFAQDGGDEFEFESSEFLFRLGVLF